MTPGNASRRAPHHAGHRITPGTASRRATHHAGQRITPGTAARRATGDAGQRVTPGNGRRRETGDAGQSTTPADGPGKQVQHANKFSACTPAPADTFTGQEQLSSRTSIPRCARFRGALQQASRSPDCAGLVRIDRCCGSRLAAAALRRGAGRDCRACTPRRARRGGLGAVGAVQRPSTCADPRRPASSPPRRPLLAGRPVESGMVTGYSPKS
jgi:hypothetical protein